jgi:integrase
VQPSQQDRRKRNRKRPPGKCYTTGTYRNAIWKGIAKANAKQLEEDLEAGLDEEERRPPIPRWSPNRLRHTAGTTVRRAAGLETSRLVLGHSKVETTQIYAESDHERAVAFVLQHGRKGPLCPHQPPSLKSPASWAFPAGP